MKTENEYQFEIDVINKKTGLKLQPEFRFHPVRKWRFDFADPENMIAIEIEGAVWTRGRHTRGKGFLGDMEKYNTAASMGWRVFRFTPENILDFLIFYNDFLNWEEMREDFSKSNWKEELK